MLRDTYKKLLHRYAMAATSLDAATDRYLKAIAEYNKLMPHMQKEMPPRMMNYSDLRKKLAEDCRIKKIARINAQRYCESLYKQLLDFHFGA